MMSCKGTLVLSLAVLTIAKLADGHSWMSCPTPYDTNPGRGGFLQASCEPISDWTNIVVTVVKRGDRLKVGWTSNNHAGGFVRISLVRHPGGSITPTERSFEENVMKVTCYGVDHDTHGGRNYGDCDHPCGARGACEYQKSVNDLYDRQRFDTSVKIPYNLDAGYYILQWKSLVGNAGSPYYGCARLRIAAEGPQTSCPPQAPSLPQVPMCDYPPGNPHSKLTHNTALGNFCYKQNARGHIDEDMATNVPVNVECDPRLGCHVSVNKGFCLAQSGMSALSNGNIQICPGHTKVATEIVNGRNNPVRPATIPPTPPATIPPTPKEGSTQEPAATTVPTTTEPTPIAEMDCFPVIDGSSENTFVTTIVLNFNVAKSNWVFYMHWAYRVKIFRVWGASFGIIDIPSEGLTEYIISSSRPMSVGQEIRLGVYASCVDCLTDEHRLPHCQPKYTVVGGGNGNNPTTRGVNVTPSATIPAPGSGVCVSPNGLYGVPGNCNLFYHCAHGTPYLKNCSGLLEFDIVEKVCTHPGQAQCAS